MSRTDMKQYGLTEKISQESSLHENLFTGRVASQYKDICKVITEYGEMLAEISGKLRFEAKSSADYPAVGDFVMLDRADGTRGNGIIHHILTRKSLLERKAAGESGEAQIIAANVDKIFICMSCNNDFNLRRLERYTAIAYASSAQPVITLTKADLCENPQDFAVQAESAAPGTEIIFTNAGKDGCQPVFEKIKPGQTAAFVGSSGVGKSTLINKLIGEEILVTKNIRSDDKGRHTTTVRELFLLPSGGIVIDTPGMRELGVESADLSNSFPDIEEIILQCKFSDCSHKNEPGCAIVNAITENRLSPERFENYLKLQKEASYIGLDSKQIEDEKFKRMFASIGGSKNMRKFIKEHYQAKGKGV